MPVFLRAFPLKDDSTSDAPQDQHNLISRRLTRVVAGRHAAVLPRRPLAGGNRMLEMTNENFARLLRGLTIAVGNRRNRILLYQFLAAEIRALHCSYGIGDDESCKRALTFLQNCERYTLRSLVRRSAKHHDRKSVV